MKRAVAPIAVALALSLPAAAAAAPGAAGIGDPYYPLAGNGGYDVAHYGLELSYYAQDRPAARHRHDHREDDPGPVALQPRPRRADRALGHRRGSGGELSPPRRRADRHAARAAPERHRLHDRDRLPRQARRRSAGARWERSRASSTPTTARSSPASRRAPRPGSRPTTTRSTRRRSRSGSPSRAAWRRSPTACSSARRRAGAARPGTGRPPSRWRPTWRRRRSGSSSCARAPPTASATGTRWTPTCSSGRAPRQGRRFAFTGIGQPAYKRLTRMIDVPAGGAELSFWVQRETEPQADFFFVEAQAAGSGRWTTLRDTNGHTSRSPGVVCPYWLAVHPFLKRYLTQRGERACAPRGTTGQWWAASGTSNGYERWTVDLARYAGRRAEVSLTYATDVLVEDSGVYVDDVAVSRRGRARRRSRAASAAGRSAARRPAASRTRTTGAAGRPRRRRRRSAPSRSPRSPASRPSSGSCQSCSGRIRSRPRARSSTTCAG